ncbi:glycosyltransferase family 2 protein [Undibacterium fentianense]|uniref:Glycosyltransferase family 2 protein n=1 Tax=Undibacterium fentianense TaxID=2828728 RepID=A0A941E5H8_9BURK|nr:glycosyltransferase family 2 protein [Undibacterium fentianense]MBR7800083.1 glycosyltransferase family 2 protein [Undibacterium fentianense]
MKNLKIAGIIHCKNDWALCAVSISYALLNHVDEVFVFNQGSSDATAEGLEHLRQYWGNRLHVFHIPDQNVEQSIVANTMIQIAAQVKPDWVYVFDADEFLLLGDGLQSTRLHDFLATVPSSQRAVRYTLKNFISMHDFDECDLQHYRRLRFVSVPHSEYNPKNASQTMYSGEKTFFDFEFPSKIICRYSHFLKLNTGAHTATHFGGGANAERNEPMLFAAHLPMLTRSRLDKRAEHGKKLMDLGNPWYAGWQQQLVYRLQQEDRLDWFWSQHSIDSKMSEQATRQKAKTDDCLVRALESTLGLLEHIFESTQLHHFRGRPIQSQAANETHLPLSQVLALTGVFQRQTEISLAALQRK